MTCKSPICVKLHYYLALELIVMITWFLQKVFEFFLELFMISWTSHWYWCCPMLGPSAGHTISLLQNCSFCHEPGGSDNVLFFSCDISWVSTFGSIPHGIFSCWTVPWHYTFRYLFHATQSAKWESHNCDHPLLLPWAVFPPWPSCDGKPRQPANPPLSWNVIVCLLHSSILFHQPESGSSKKQPSLVVIVPGKYTPFLTASSTFIAKAVL